MKCIMEFDKKDYLPVLKLYIFGAPHCRQLDVIHKAFRETLIREAKKIKLKIPIDYPIDLYVVFIDPTTPDLDNLIDALYRALDAKASLKTVKYKGESILTDDGLIQKVIMSKFYPNGPLKNENRIP